MNKDKDKDKDPRNDKGQRHGFRIAYVYDYVICNNPTIWFSGQYLNNFEYGYWIGNWKRKKHEITFYLR